MEKDFKTIARARYERQIHGLEGHHCPPWEGLSVLMREHLIFLASQPDDDDPMGYQVIGTP